MNFNTNKCFINAIILHSLIAFLLSINTLSCKKANHHPALEAHQGMVWVNKKTFLQGGKKDDPYKMPRELPALTVTVSGFYIDITEVTNKQFKAFVDATGYITVAERVIDWNLVKKTLPQNTPKPADSLLKPGSLVFNKNVEGIVNMQNFTQWWTWKIGANWKHPKGPNSSIKGKDDYPVVHIAMEDAKAYCKWANRRLPTESEWEAAAQGTYNSAIFTWGNDASLLNKKANTWQGQFPVKNEPTDGFKYVSPVKSYPPNSIGIYDMTGNVWELTQDYFDVNYYSTIAKNNKFVNLKGAKSTHNPDSFNSIEYVVKGGSFLCNASYCASYRISARMGFQPESSSDHTGFRTVLTHDMMKE